MNKDQIAHRMRDNLARAGTGLAEDRTRLWHDGDALLTEVLKLWPEPDDAFIRGLVPLLLGREADAEGMAYGLALLRHSSRLRTVQTIALCDEAQARGLDTSWLPRLDQLRPEGLHSLLRQASLRALKALLHAPSRLVVTAFQRLRRSSGKPFQGPMADARQMAAPAPRARLASMPSQASGRLGPSESIQEQRWFEVANQLNQLRRVCASLVPASTAAVADPPQILTRERSAALQNSSACRVCGGALAFKFRARVLNDRYEAEYHECVRCAALQIPDPSWLEEAYRAEDGPRFWNPDVGRFRRNFSVYCYLCAFRDTGVLAPQPRLLDYGGGYGLLTQMLRDAGFDAWLADPHVARPFFGPERHIADLNDLPADSFDAATAFEVYEHLTDPCRVGDELRRILRPDGVFVLSTGIYRPEVHGADWQYLHTQMGQHVTFWSRTALSHYAARLGFRSVGYSPSTEGFAIIFSTLSTSELKARLAQAAKLLQQPDFLGRATRCWELAQANYFQIPPEPLVEPARLCHAEVACAS